MLGCVCVCELVYKCVRICVFLQRKKERRTERERERAFAIHMERHRAGERERETRETREESSYPSLFQNQELVMSWTCLEQNCLLWAKGVRSFRPAFFTESAGAAACFASNVLHCSAEANRPFGCFASLLKRDGSFHKHKLTI